MKRILIIVASVALVGCGSLVGTQRKAFRGEDGVWHYQRVEVLVDAYAAVDEMLLDRSAVLVCLDTTLAVWDLRRAETENHLRKALAARGYSFGGGEPSIVITYNVGVSEPQVYQREVSVPLYGDTGVSSSTTTTSKNERGETVSRTTYDTSRGVVGYRSEMRTTTTFVRWINLTAWDEAYRRQRGEPQPRVAGNVDCERFPAHKMLWQMEIISEGENSDLRYAVPFMLVAAQRYIETNTNRRVAVLLGDDPADKRVVELRGF